MMLLHDIISDLVDVFPSILRPRPTKDIDELTSAAFNRILTALDVSFQGKLNVIDLKRVRIILYNVILQASSSIKAATDHIPHNYKEIRQNSFQK